MTELKETESRQRRKVESLIDCCRFASPTAASLTRRVKQGSETLRYASGRTCASLQLFDLLGRLKESTWFSDLPMTYGTFK
jgi:hypothetical protein